MPQNLKCTLVQYPIAWHDTQANCNIIRKHCEGVDTDVIVLPETFNTGFSMSPETVSKEDQKEATVFLRSLAKEKDALVIASTIFSAGVNDYRNRLFACLPDGNVHTYDKKHLFSFAKEDQHFTAGKERLIFEFKGWRINPLICYDLRFPVFSRNSNEHPFDLQIFVSNWPGVRISAWDILLQARSVENQCFVLGSNRVGEDPNDISYNGHSQAFNPYGKQMLSFEDGEEGAKTIQLDGQKLQDFRSKFPVLADADAFTLH